MGSPERQDDADPHAQQKLTPARQRRLWLFDRSRPYTPLIGVETETGRFLVDTSDEVLGRLLFVKEGRREPRTLAAAMALLDVLDQAEDSRRGVFIDVGANIGTTTVPALLDHGFPAAVAFEPNPANVQLLRANLLLNDLEDLVTINELAVSERTGSVRLLVDPKNSGGHRVAQAEHDSATSIEVPSTTLDEASADRLWPDPEPGFLWIDVEGHDPQVLLGAESFLRRGVPTVFEIYPARIGPPETLDRLVDVLAENYDAIVDLRQIGAAIVLDQELQTVLRPVAALRDLLDPGGTYVTDVLAVRLPDDRRAELGLNRGGL